MLILAYKTPPASVTADLIQLLNWGAWIAMICCIAGLMFAGARLAYNREVGRHDINEPSMSVFIILIAGVLISASTGLATALLGG